MNRRLQSLWLVGMMLFSATAVADDSSEAMVDHLPGALAVQTDAAAGWRQLAQGDRLPEDCLLQSGLSRTCRIDLPGGALDVAPDTRLRLKLSARSVTLESGRIFLATPAGAAKPWSSTVAGLQITLAQPCAAELTVEADKRFVLCVTEGSASVAASGKPRIVVAAGSEWRWNAVEQKFASQALAAAAKARIEAWTRPRPSQGLGQLVIQDAQSKSPVRLNIARYHVHVVLRPPVALVQVDQSFYNPLPRQEEGTFVFNLPPRASVSRFAMYVAPGELVEGELIERERAAGIYQSIVSRQRDPAILEQIGNHLFRMRVFPIFARDTKRILLDYTVPLESAGGVCRFQLPLLSDLNPIWDFQLSGAIQGAVRSGSASSPSHPGLAFQARKDGAIDFQLRENNYQPKSDFSVSFAVPDNTPAGLRSHRAEPLPPPTIGPAGDVRNRVEREWGREAATYFMVSLPPEREAPGAPPPADVLILADTSDSMRKVAILRQAVRSIVRHLRPADRMRLMGADVEARPLHEGWLTPGSPQAQAAMARLDREFCLGRTDLAGCLMQAARQFDAQSPRRRLVIYVGGAETSRFTEIATLSDDWKRFPDHLRQARISLAGVIVRRTAEGPCQWESLPRAAGAQMFDLFGRAGSHRDLLAWLLAGMPEPTRILDLKVEGVPVADADLFFAPVCLPGQTIHILGRTRSAAGQVRLSLTTSAGDKSARRTWELAVDPKQDDVFVGRLWAQERLDRLQVEKTRAGADPNALKLQIVALSQEWSLLTPLTALLVLENEEQYRQYQVDRNQRRRYWKPDDAKPQSPLPDDWLKLVLAAAEKENQQAKAQRFAATIRSARAALEAGNASQAMDLLARESRSELAQKSAEYVGLRKQAIRAISDRALPRSLGPHQSLLDPSAPAPLKVFARGLPQLLAGSAEINPEFNRRHPYARQLLADMPFRWPTPGRAKPTLNDLVGHLRMGTSANVMLDRKALADAGIHEDSEATVYGAGQISLRNYVRSALRQMDLVLVEEPYRLLITTPEKSDARLTTEVIPVADLLFTDRTASPSLLVDPYFDRDQQAAERIRAKLKQPISIHFLETPLEKALLELAGQLNDNLIVDQRALDDAGVTMDTPVTADWRGVPAKESLKWLLQSVDLAYVIRDEAIVITTPEQADAQRAVRLHSGHGILYALPPPPEWTDPSSQGEDGVRRDGRGSGGRMGVVMGGMVGGMGGAGGGMGGMGGGMGGMGAFGRPTEGFGVPPVESDPLAPTVPTGAPSGAGSLTPDVGAAEGPAFAGAGGDRIDVDSLVDMVTSTVRPTTWDAVGGPGSVGLFELTLDLVFAQTDEVHEEIAELFERLRRLPTAIDPKSDLQPARVPAVTTHEHAVGYVESLIDLITTIVLPTTWDAVGGPSSITMDEPRLALILSAHEETHDGVWQLLTMLRRSRYASLRSDRPWETPLVALPWSPLAAGWPESCAALRIARFPQPPPEALKLLAVRRVSGEGQWKWRRLTLDPASQQTIAVRRAAGRMELHLPESVLRTEGDRAAIAWPGLALVEHGDWAELARQSLDACLPWMPHRGNDELARLFRVERVSEPAGNAAAGARLRLRPHGLQGQPDSCLLVSFSEKSGLPQTWESYLSGRLTGRLRFSDARDGDAGTGWGNVVLEDAAGKPLVRWELIESSPQAQPIADLAAGWEGYVQLDRRADGANVDREFHQALTLIGKRNWAAAVQQLEAALKVHPQQPLLLLLRAWCHDQDPRAGNRAEISAALRQVAASRAIDLVRFLGEKRLTWLTPGKFYEILLAQPEATRSDVDWEHLAVAAADNGLFTDWLRYMEKTPAGSIHRERALSALIGALKDAKHAADAKALAEKIGDPRLRTPLLLRQAELLAKPAEAGDVLWRVYRDGQLPAERLDWACSTWNRGLQYARTIEAIEAGLRSDNDYPSPILNHLAEAYFGAGRDGDAWRATSSSQSITTNRGNSAPRGRSWRGGGIF